MTSAERFVRLARGAAGGTRLCGRDQVDAALSYQQAMDEHGFLEQLRRRLGEPDEVGDALFSYSIRDQHTGIEFEVYSARSGPCYGGPADFFDASLPPPYLRADVHAALAAFEAWLGRV